MANPVEQQNSAWHDGWWSGAQKIASPNFGPRPVSACIDLVVLHSISLPPGVYGGDGVLRLFTNTLDWDAHPYYQTIRGMEVSSHFFIARTGLVSQFVSCDQRAWHAGKSHYRGRDNCNDDSIGIELEGVDTDIFSDEQYISLRCLCTAIAAQYPITFLAGHEHIAPGRKTDPGPGLRWESFKNLPGIAHWQMPSDVRHPKE